MNRYQKLTTQIVKDDMKKRLYRCLGTNFYRHRKIVKVCFIGYSLAGIKEFRNLNKNLDI